MKLITTVYTPVGTFYSKSDDGFTESTRKEFEEFLTKDLKYLSLVDKYGDTLIVKGDILANSVIHVQVVPETN